MPVTDHIAAPTAAGDADADARALFEEARLRRRRRRLWVAAALVVLTGSVAAFALTIGSGGTTRPTKTAATGRAGGIRTIRSLTFTGSFSPQQVVSESGRIWLVGSTAPDNRNCVVEEIDPASLRRRTFPLPACGSYLAVGGGRIFLADGVFTGVTDTTAFHVESFDTATGRGVVMAPVVIATTGTGYAHMAMTYAGGWLWMTPWSDEALEISPSTGSVVRTITGLPTSTGGHPLIVGGPGGTWSAGGAGSPLIIDRIDPRSTTPAVVYRGSRSSSVLWLSPVGDRVWAEVGTYVDGGRAVVTRLVAFDSSGKRVLETSPEESGDLPVVGSGGELWSVGSGARCDGPQRLWRIDSRTGKSVAAATLPSPVAPCLVAADGSELAAVGDSVFVLDPASTFGPGSVLYRISL